MDKVILPKQHYSLTIIKDVNIICQPFFKISEITGCLFGRFFDDGSAFFLTSEQEYYINYFAKGYPMVPIMLPKNLPNKFFYLVNQNQFCLFNQVYYETLSIFKFDNIIYLIDRSVSYYEMFAFGSAPNNNKIVNFYLNNIDILEKFKFYFREKAAKIIKKSAQHKLLIPEHLRSPLRGLSIADAQARSDYLSVPTELTINRYYLNNGNTQITLTKRELSILKNLKMGLTIKEIAKQTQLSPRTVESYLENIKSKFKLQKKSEILYAADQLGLLNL